MLKDKYLLGILIIGIILRIASLDLEPVWLDEAYSLFHAQFSVSHIFVLPDPNFPTYITLLKAFNSSTFSFSCMHVVLRSSNMENILFPYLSCNFTPIILSPSIWNTYNRSATYLFIKSKKLFQ
jgi:hypothetical protein